jgi:hypothetical protein
MAKKNGKKRVYPEPLKVWMRKQVAYLRKHMCLNEWDFMLCWCGVPAKGAEEVVLHIAVDADYLRATIHVPHKFLDHWLNPKYSKMELMQMLVHEMCHIIIDPLYFALTPRGNKRKDDARWMRSIREQTTQRVAYLVFPTIPAKQYD